MHTNSPTTTQTLHFRRWSNKGYASFCSIGRCVVIGRLRNAIADASLRKQENYAYAPTADTDVLSFDDSSDAEERNAASPLLLGGVSPSVIAAILNAVPQQQSAAASAKFAKTLTSKCQSTSRNCTSVCGCDSFCFI